MAGICCGSLAETRGSHIVHGLLLGIDDVDSKWDRLVFWELPMVFDPAVFETPLTRSHAMVDQEDKVTMRILPSVDV